MRSGTILTLSICGNLLLLGVLGYLHKSRPAPAQSAVVIQAMTNVAAESQWVVSNAPVVATLVTNRFHWRKVESDDYEKYIANLRAIGCPEKTIQDIILADVEKLFAERSRRANYQEVFWQTGSQRKSARQAQEQGKRALDKEKRDLIRKLLGIEWNSSGRAWDKDLKELAIFTFFVGPAPEGASQQVVSVVKKYEALREEMTERSLGILLPTDYEQMKKTRAQMVQEFAAILNPAQLQEFSARMAITDLLDNDQLDGTGVTAAECREMALIKVKLEGAFVKMFNWDDSEEEEKASGQRSAQLDAEIKKLLGEPKFTEVQRMKEPSYRELREFAAEHGLPKESAVKIYELKQLSDTELAQVQGDRTVDTETRAAQLREIREATAQGVAGLLGAKQFESYLKGSGSWMTNVSR